jgi:hypothetical protein
MTVSIQLTHLPSRCAYRRHALRAALLGFIYCAAPSDSKAATFEFEAVVTEANIRSPELLPFAIEEGNLIRGSFDVPPTTFTSADVENIALKLRFEHALLQLDGLFGRMYSDRFIGGDPGETPIGPVDVIALGCIGDEPGQARLTCIAGNVSGASDVEWRPTLSFGIDDVLSEGDDLSDAETWNSFPARQLSLEFATGSNAFVGSVRAAVGHVVLVPEAVSMSYIAGWLLSFMVTRLPLRDQSMISVPLLSRSRPRIGRMIDVAESSRENAHRRNQ